MREDIVIVRDVYYRLPRRSRRIASWTIDLLLLASICILLGVTLLPFTIPLAVIYLFLGNGIFGGRNMGKRIMGLKIIDAKHGCAITPLQDLVRHRHALFHSPVFLALAAFDSLQGNFDKPETYVVIAKPLTSDEIAALAEKPAKLDLEGMRRSLQKPK